MNTDGNRQLSDPIEISNPELLPAHPVVSVHMLAYNHGPYLAEAIEGVIAQQIDFPIELIIGEDCSTDNTREIALDYQRRYPHLIRLIYSERNVGMLENYRRVMYACLGEYIAFCEGDDYWHHPAKLQMQVAFLREHPECVVVHSDYDYRVGARVRRSIMKTERRHIPVGKAYDLLQEGNWIGTASVLYRSEVLRSFEQTAIAARNYRFGDYSRLLHASLYGEIGYLDQSLATYRYMPGSAMNSGSKSTLSLRQSVRQCRLDFIEETGRIPLDHDLIERQEYRLLYGCAYLAGDIDVFQEVYRWLLQKDPGFLAAWKHPLRLVIMRSRLLLWLVQVRAFVNWRLSILRHYERIDG